MGPDGPPAGDSSTHVCAEARLVRTNTTKTAVITLFHKRIFPIEFLPGVGKLPASYVNLLFRIGEVKALYMPKEKNLRLKGKSVLQRSSCPRIMCGDGSMSVSGGASLVAIQWLSPITKKGMLLRPDPFGKPNKFGTGPQVACRAKAKISLPRGKIPCCKRLRLNRHPRERA